MTREPKLRILILDAAEPAEGLAHLPWHSGERYMDRRRSYLFNMAEIVVIRDTVRQLEVRVKDRGRRIKGAAAKATTDGLVDTMAACGFGFA